MPDKIIAQIVYMPGKGEPTLIYENDKGQMWHSCTHDPNRINIAMGWYSASDLNTPAANECLLVAEPYCILPRDYNYDFANKFNKIFTWTPKAFDQRLQNKILEINLPSIMGFPSNETIYSKWLPWKDREDKIIFIANNKTSDHESELYSLRVQLADNLHKKSKFKVEWYAQIPIDKPYYKGSIESKNEILTKAKFSVCTENSYDYIYTYNYFTEKLPEVWIAGTLPLYIGCFNIDNFGFTEHSYIDLRTYVNKQNNKFIVDYDSLIARLEGYNEQRYNNYLDTIRANIFENNLLKNIISFDKIYDKIINHLYDDLNK